MFSRFSEESQKVLNDARMIMMDLKHSYVGSEHLLLALLKNSYDIGVDSIDYDSYLEELINVVGIGSSNNSWFLYTPVLKRIIENAAVISKEMNSKEIMPEQLYLSLLEEGEGTAIRILNNFNVDIDDLYDEISKKVYSRNNKTKKKLLVCEYGFDLTKKASDNLIDPVIGREEEVNSLINILSRRYKNNPLLVGDAGVGKTAIVEVLAKKIVNGDVPDNLKNKKIIDVSVSSLVAGTKYRGEFEERFDKLLKELESNDDIILFIDEVHTIVGAGGAEGAIDAANILKPALARGKIKMIGATTLDEYKKTIEKDKAFDRRFHKIIIDEPDFDKTLNILTKIKDLYQRYHGVDISDEVLRCIISLTNKYEINKKQPDKSIDILDQVLTYVKIKSSASKDNKKRTEMLIDVEKRKKEAIINHDFIEASKLRRKQRKIENGLKNNYKISSRPCVKLEDVYYIVSNKTGIPIYNFEYSKPNFFNKKYNLLTSKVIGQDEAILKLIQYTKRMMLGISNKNKPYSFLFVGSTGVGKTYLAKTYADTFFKKNSLVRFDMSEYKEEHSISKILGSPSGYVGYDDSNNKLEEIRNNPHCVILLDEIEKAHPSVLNLFLQILDEGKITDSKGVVIDFSNSVIIMTSNIGCHKNNLGFIEDKNEVVSDAKDFLSKEFINRIDEVIVFNKLSYGDIEKLVDIKVKCIKDMYKEKGIILKVNENVKKEIINMCDYQEYGARCIDKVLDSKLNRLVIDQIIEGKSNISIKTLNNR